MMAGADSRFMPKGIQDAVDKARRKVGGKPTWSDAAGAGKRSYIIQPQYGVTTRTRVDPSERGRPTRRRASSGGQTTYRIRNF